MPPAHVVLLALLAAMGVALAASLAMPRKGSSPSGSRKAPRGRGGAETAQDAMPLAAIRGHFAWMKDGSYRAYFLWPGRNQSIDTPAERMSNAFRDAAVLSSIDVRFSIMKYPEQVSSSRQLAAIDAAIEREKRAYFAAADPAQREARRLRVAILEGSMREEAVREAMGAGRTNWPTYIAMDFPAGRDTALAEQTISNFLRVASGSMERPPELLGERGIRHLYQLYFTPSSVSDIAAGAADAILPDYGMFTRRKDDGQEA